MPGGRWVYFDVQSVRPSLQCRSRSPHKVIAGAALILGLRQISFSAACYEPSAKRENVGVWGRSPHEKAPCAYRRSGAVAAFVLLLSYRHCVRSPPLQMTFDERGPLWTPCAREAPLGVFRYPNRYLQAQLHY